MDMLDEIVREINHNLAIVIDGGFREGVDIYRPSL